MKYKKNEVASMIDLAVLAPNATWKDVQRGVELALHYDVASLCVQPCNLPLIEDVFKGSSVLPSCVLSFPHGADSLVVKESQADVAVRYGAKEIDMVINIGALLAGNYEDVETDILAVTQTVPDPVVVKVILETAYLNEYQIKTACAICLDSGADFVKTSTGFASQGATPEAVQIMLDACNEYGQGRVKASGGIRDWETACMYLNMGCTRLGVGISSIEKILG